VTNQYSDLLLVPYAGRKPLTVRKLEGFQVKWVDVSTSEYRYWSMLAYYWGSPQTIYIVEHDLLVESSHLNELKECNQLLCTHAYKIFKDNGSTFYCQNHFSDPYLRGQSKWLNDNEESAMFSGLGCCKIEPILRRRLPQRSPFNLLDQAVNRALDHRWHVHWPGVEHAHNGSLFPEIVQHGRVHI
jgi:hypothetical protein